MMEDKSKRLADEHWAWLETVLKQQLEVTGKLFEDSFVHGYKHGQYDMNDD